MHGKIRSSCTKPRESKVDKSWRISPAIGGQSAEQSRDKLHRQNRSDGRRGSSADIQTWMLWPVLGDDGLSPTSPPASASVKGVNKLAPLLLCAPCKPSSHRKNQNSTQWYVQQVNRHPRDSSSSVLFPRWSILLFSFFNFSFLCIFLHPLAVWLPVDGALCVPACWLLVSTGFRISRSTRGNVVVEPSRVWYLCSAHSLPLNGDCRIAWDCVLNILERVVPGFVSAPTAPLC